MTDYEINGKQYQVEYDLDNRITKVDVDNDDVEYRYDALGRRVIRKEGTTTSALIWWGNSECAEHKHQAGQTVIQNDIMSHPTRLNSVIARAVDGSKFKLEWYHKNYLDHVYAVSDDSGDLIEHYRYTAFGEVTIYDANGAIQTATQIENTIMWNTRRLDSLSGYYLYKYRHYDPALGRWPSRDPIEENGGVNLYAFVGNDPVAKWDELGQNAKAILAFTSVVAPAIAIVANELMPQCLGFATKCACKKCARIAVNTGIGGFGVGSAAGNVSCLLQFPLNPVARRICYVAVTGAAAIAMRDLLQNFEDTLTACNVLP